MIAIIQKILELEPDSLKINNLFKRYLQGSESEFLLWSYLDKLDKESGNELTIEEKEHFLRYYLMEDL